MTMLPAEVLDALHAIDLEIARVRQAQPPSRRVLAQRHKNGEHYSDACYYADVVKRWRRWRERRVNALLVQKQAVKRAHYEAGART